MLERGRPGVVADGAQAERQVAERLAPGEGLDGRREDQEDGHQGADPGHPDQRGVGLGGDHEQEQHHEHQQRQGDRDVDHPRDHPDAEAGRGQVERHGLAGDEVVVGEGGELGRSRGRVRHGPRISAAAAYSGRVDLDAYVHAHLHEWRRLEELTRRRRLSGDESDEFVERYQQVATHLSVVRTSAPDASLVAYLSSVLAKARTRSSGTRTTSWRGVARFFTERFPAALYRLRYWWLGTLAASVLVTGVMIWWLLGNPVGGAEPALARAGRPAGQPGLRELLQRVRRLALRAPGLGQQRVGGRAVPGAGDPGRAGGLPAVQQHLEPRDHRLDHAAQRPRRALLRADPPARAARADRGLRGGRGGAAAVLVVGRAGPAVADPVGRARGPHRRHRRARPRRRAASSAG